jgi:cell wall-associated NlpC family hydrolase
MRFDDLIGKPFVDMGRGPEGFDCWGIVLEVNRRLGRDLPDYPGVHICEQDVILARIAAHRCEFDRVSDPQPGDVVLYKQYGDHLHFGAVIDGARFIHCSEGMGVKINRFDHPLIRQLIEGFYRCKTNGNS